MYNFKRKNNTFIQIKLGDQFVTEPKNIADAFANHFKSTFNTSFLTVTSPYSTTTDFSSAVPISAAKVSRAIKCLKPSRCVCLDGIPSFIIKGCSVIFIQ
jgi:hypothetical protein